jgi:hypothetical protein
LLSQFNCSFLILLRLFCRVARLLFGLAALALLFKLALGFASLRLLFGFCSPLLFAAPSLKGLLLLNPRSRLVSGELLTNSILCESRYRRQIATY